MEIAGLGIGIAGLAGIFSTCLDVVERIDSYRDFGVDSRAIISQFEADKLLFQRWGKAVGIDGRNIENTHHANLDDPAISKAVEKILFSINEIAGGSDSLSTDQQYGSDHSSQRTKSRGLPFHKFQGAASRKEKVEWTLRHKARFIALSQQFGNLVARLRDLVPPKSASADGMFSAPDQSIDIGSHLADSQRIFMELEKQIERETRNDIDAWLGASSPNSLYHNASQKRLPGTCDWILSRDAFRDWESLHCPPETAKVLWINGPAGYGKTVLVARIVEHFEAQPDSLMGYFFFSADLADRADPFVVMRSWVSQISLRNQDAFEIAYERYITQDAKTASTRDVTELFKDILRQVPGCTFIVDGLDECTSRGGWLATQSDSITTFVHTTTRAVAGTSSRILLVSREDQDIRTGFFSTETNNAGLQLVEYKLTPTDVKPDATMLSQRIVNQKLANKTQLLRDELSQRMVDRCDSMFLRIRLLENDLRGGKTQKQLERMVDHAPTELSQLYHRNWRRILEGETDRTRALSIIRWVAFSLRPMTIAEITEALLFEEDDTMDTLEDELPDAIDETYIKTEILDLCASLVEARAAPSMEDLGSRTLHLTHFTVKQYVLLHLPTLGGHLTADENLKLTYESMQNNILAETCLRYLRFPGLWLDSQPNATRGRFERAFRGYAASSWYQHTKSGCSNYETIKRLMVEFVCSGQSDWEGWRKYYDVTQEQSSPMLHYQGEITTSNRLFYASSLRIQDLVEHLMEKTKVDVNNVDESSRTALFVAAAEGRYTLVQYLLDKGADINIASNEGRTPFYAALDNGHTTIANFLLGNGADTNTRSIDGWTPLHSAAAKGYYGMAKLLFENGADSISQGEGWTPLFLAAQYGHLDVVRLLLENGADSTSQVEGWTPLNCAADEGHFDVVKLLLEHGADWAVPNNNGWTPLNCAADEGHFDVVKLLLEHGADWAVPNNEGWTPLNCAANEGHFDVVKLLLEHGADWAVPSNNGWTPLNCAADKGHFDVVKLLLEHGANWAVSRTTGASPLHIALRGGYVSVVEPLLGHATQFWTMDNLRRSPIFHASQGGLEVFNLLQHSEDDAIRRLVAQEIHSNSRDYYGSTFLSVAVRFGHSDLVNQLLAIPDINCGLEDDFGRSALWWARRQGHRNIEERLLEHARNRSLDTTTLEAEPREPKEFKPNTYTCDVCLASIREASYLHCTDCNGGDFDICLECQALGAHCLVETHTLLRREKN